MAFYYGNGLRDENVVRHKHDRRHKVHAAMGIEYRGKPDSAYVECTCGYHDLVAVWYFDAVATIWTDRCGKPIPYYVVSDAVRLYLAAVHPEGEWIRPGLVDEMKAKLKKWNQRTYHGHPENQ